MADSGALEKIIAEKIEKTIRDILDESLKSWSPFGKALKEHIAAELRIDLTNLGIGGYNDIVIGIVKRKLEQAIDSDWKTKLEESIEHMLRDAPAEMKVSEILEAIRDDHDDDAEDEKWEVATCIVETTKYQSRWLYFDPAPQDEKYRCRYRVLVSGDGTSASTWVDGKENERLLTGCLHGFERLLFRLRASGTKIIFDLDPGRHSSEYYEWVRREG